MKEEKAYRLCFKKKAFIDEVIKAGFSYEHVHGHINNGSSQSLNVGRIEQIEPFYLIVRSPIPNNREHKKAVSKLIKLAEEFDEK